MRRERTAKHQPAEPIEFVGWGAIRWGRRPCFVWSEGGRLVGFELEQPASRPAELGSVGCYAE